MDGNAIRFHEGDAIGDKAGSEELMSANIYYSICYFVFVGNITKLHSAEVKGIAEDGEVADGDVYGVEGYVCSFPAPLPVPQRCGQAIESGGGVVVVAAGVEP